MRALAAGLALLALTGCSYEGAQSLPLPGAVGGKDTYTVTVVLDDATNLVVKETCRANDSVIGSVESIELDKELKARVVCRIRNDVDLPANITASLRETSLLGERFVSLDPVAGQQPTGRLAAGSTVPAAATRVDPNVEMVLGALSQVLNGGSLGSIETITRELNVALSQSDLAAGIKELGSFTATLDARRDDITRSLVALDTLAGKLAEQRSVIADTLDSVPNGLAVLERQRPRLVRALARLSELSRTAVPLIQRSKANTVADLQHLRPILTELTKSGQDIALTLERLGSFPFPSNTLAILRGDYGGMTANFDIDIDMLNALIEEQAGAGKASTTPQAQQPGQPALPLLDQPLLDLLGLGSGQTPPLLDLGSVLGGLG